MQNNAFNGRKLLAGLPLITGPLLDGARIGTFGVVCVGKTVNTTDTVIAHTLGRAPNGYLLYRATAGSLIDATTGVAAWTFDSITLRSTTGGVYSWILI